MNQMHSPHTHMTNPTTLPPLMAMLQKSIAHSQPTLISIEGHGSISIYPDQGSYTTDICDWHSLPYGDGSAIGVSSVVWATAPQGSMPLGELRWLAAYHHASHLPESRAMPLGLVKLLHWPDLSEVPQELAAPIVRICALLWRKPTASTLVAQIVGAEAAQTDALLHVLQGFRHIAIASRLPDRVDEEAQAHDTLPIAQAPSVRASVIAKLWQRLAGR
jgi:hypothetical protein